MGQTTVCPVLDTSGLLHGDDERLETGFVNLEIQLPPLETAKNLLELIRRTVVGKKLDHPQKRIRPRIVVRGRDTRAYKTS